MFVHDIFDNLTDELCRGIPNLQKMMEEPISYVKLALVNLNKTIDDLNKKTQGSLTYLNDLFRISSIFKERKSIAHGGMISCTCIVNSSGKFTCQPIIEHYGVFDVKKQDEIKGFQKALRGEIVELVTNFANISQSKKAIEKTISHIIAKSMRISHGKVPLINVIFHVI
jgi:hypothetical protein